MRYIRKTICLLLALCTLLSNGAVLTLAASEDPQALKDLKEFGAAMPMETPEKKEPAETQPAETQPAETQPEETVPAETASAETQPAETKPAETVPAETLPAETQPAETLPAETVPEETKAEETAWEPMGHNDIPLLFQTDYPNNMYGVGTIANNGCGIVSLAMVANYLTGHEYQPDELARYFGGAAENNIARLELGSKMLQLPFRKAENWHETLAALKEGKVAIALVGGDSIFTESQHFVVLAGMTEDGKILVNDPYEPNYQKWNLKNGLQNGFDESAILLGYSGAWIYDKESMPEEPFIYSKPLPVRGEPRYGIELTWEERQLLAKVVWVEARGESMEGQQAVAEVVFNRMVSEGFSDSLYNVIYSAGQFRSVPYLEDAEPYQMQYEVIENALYGPYVLPMDVVYFSTGAVNDQVWGQIGGHVFCYAEG